MHHVYVLISLKDRRLYVGYTTDMNHRMTEHRSGHVLSTQNRQPVKLIYFESYLTSKEAKRRELYLKGGNGRAGLKKQLIFTLAKFGYKHL